MLKTLSKSFLLVLILLANFLLLKSIFRDLPAQAAVAPAPAADDGVHDWVITANFVDHDISLIDVESSQTYGPFLQGQLGVPDPNKVGLFDVAVTPDFKTALISNFQEKIVYLVDVTDPFSPTLAASVAMPGSPLDIEITRDGKYALATDGGNTPYIWTLDILSHTVVYTANVSPLQTSAVAIAPDNTVVTVGYFDNSIHSHLLMPSGEITHTIQYTDIKKLSTTTSGPINVAIAPDGQTVIIASAQNAVLTTYRITAPGLLTFTGAYTNPDGVRSSIPFGAQSIAFNQTGDKAYVAFTDYTEPDIVRVLDILGPGQVRLDPNITVTLRSHASALVFGTDTLALYGNDYLFAGNPSNYSSIGIPGITRVNLTDFVTTSLPAGNYPSGTGILYSQRPLTVQKTGTGSGVVQSDSPGIDCGAACSASFAHTTVLTFTAAPNADSIFFGWSGDCSGTGVCVVDLSYPKPYTVTAQFMKDQPLTIQKTDSGSGVVQSQPTGVTCGATCSQDFHYNTAVTLTASANPFNLFTGWSGDCSGLDDCIVRMTEPHTITARFIPNHQLLPFIYNLTEVITK